MSALKNKNAIFSFFTEVKEGFMIKILSTSVPYNQPLTNQETEAAVAIIDYINKCFEKLGLGIGSADLQVIKHPDRGHPQFCPQSRNSELPCDQIYLDMDSLEFWCQLIFQASHEFTHCVIHRLNGHEDQKALWIEETICEAMSLVLLNTFANNWSRCALSKINLSFAVSIQNYLVDQLKKRGNHRLGNCCGIEELQEINRTSEHQRADRREERNRLFYLIQSTVDIQALVHYRDFVVPGTFLLDAQRYQDEYPASLPVQYLCSLQEDALRRDTVIAGTS